MPIASILALSLALFLVLSPALPPPPFLLHSFIFLTGVIMPSTPSLIPNAELPSTPSTSPQRHQQAAHNQEHNQHNIGLPEQHRTPIILLHPPASPPVIVKECELTHLSLNMHMYMMDIPPHQPLQRCGHAPPQPFPLSAFTSGSSSVAPALGSAFGLPLSPPLFPSASSS